MPNDAAKPPLNDPAAISTSHFHDFLQDARELLDYAIATGQKIDDRIIDAIQAGEQHALTKKPPEESVQKELAKAYRDLTSTLSPVTIETLRATAVKAHKPSIWNILGKGQPISVLWSRRLWAWTFLFVLAAFIGETLEKILTQYYPLDEETGFSISLLYVLSTIFKDLTPFMYGGIGSLVFLLKSCHEYIHKREFDPKRIPEYSNRILLGVVSGGIIILFIQQIPTEQGILHISGAALGFLAGYSTDFLFQTIERVIAALLPKVGVETLKQEKPSALPIERLDPLLNRYIAAQDNNDRKLIENLLNKLVDKM